MMTSSNARHAIELHGRTVEYAARVSATAKRSRIRVNPSGVEVVLSKDKENLGAEAFLAEHADWVLAQLAYVERAGSLFRKSDIVPEWTILLRGHEMPVRVVEEQTSRRYAIIDEKRKHLRIRIPVGGDIDPAQALEVWLRRQAKDDLLHTLAQRSAEMGVTYGRVYVMAQRTKWAGCSAKRNLSFNWRLVMTPPEVLDYIVVHELTHLLERDHTTRFWLIVGSHCPDYNRHKDWLRQHGQQLRVQPHSMSTAVEYFTPVGI